MAHVIVPEQTPKLSYSVTTPEEDTFNINFVIFESDGSDIDVFDLDVLLSPTLYTITPIPGTDGGSVGGTLVLNTPVTDTTIVIARNIALERTSDFPTAGPFNITALNTELDRQTGMIQQINQEAKTSFGESISIVEASNLKISEPASIRGGKIIGFDVNGDIELQTGVGLWQDNWITSTLYGLRDVVRDDAAGDDTKNLYICVIEHTSGTWSTDLAANNWDLMVDVESVTISETNAAASEAAASVSETNAGVSETNAAASESAASTSEANAATSETNAATSETNAGISETNAANSAATINLPDISGSDVGDMLVVDAGKTGYDFAVPGTGDLISTNNLSDVSSAPTSLSNLGGIGSATTDTLTNKTFDANGTGNVLSNIDIGNCIAASQAEAEAGTDNTKIVTPLRVSQAITALGGSEGWVLIGTVVASGSTTLTITGLSSAYDTYAIAMSALVPSVDISTFALRVGDSGGIDTGAADYSYHVSTSQSNGAGYQSINDDNADRMRMSTTVGSGAGEGFGALIYLTRPGDGNTVPIFTGTVSSLNSISVVNGGQIMAARKAIITLDRVQLLVSSGNMTAGRFSVWGIPHA